MLLCNETEDLLALRCLLVRRIRVSSTIQAVGGSSIRFDEEVAGKDIRSLVPRIKARRVKVLLSVFGGNPGAPRYGQFFGEGTSRKWFTACQNYCSNVEESIQTGIPSTVDTFVYLASVCEEIREWEDIG